METQVKDTEIVDNARKIMKSVNKRSMRQSTQVPGGPGGPKPGGPKPGGGYR